jgi:hypothetical protein
VARVKVQQRRGCGGRSADAAGGNGLQSQSSVTGKNSPCSEGSRYVVSCCYGEVFLPQKTHLLGLLLMVRERPLRSSGVGSTEANAERVFLMKCII